MSCFIGLSSLVCWTVLSYFIGLPGNVFKALGIQRILTDKTVGYFIAYKNCTAELNVLRWSTISSANSYLQFYTYLAVLYLLQNWLSELLKILNHIAFWHKQYQYIYVGNSISKLQIQVTTYVFELSAGNCHR